MVAFAAQNYSPDRGLSGARQDVPVWPCRCGATPRRTIDGSRKRSTEMKNRFFKTKAMALWLVVLVMLMPMAANAGVQDIISLLTTIISTLQNGVGSVLSGIQSINTTVRNFEQQVVWPLTLINQTRAEVSQVRAQFTRLAGQIQSIPTNSATLVNPSQLEQLLRSQRVGNLGQISASYTQVYQSLPQANQATANQRNLMDVDDAFALGALKTATASDQASQQMLNVADGLEQQAAVSAPGSASILTAQAQAANLQNQAMLQKLLAAELRQEAARLAHTNALRKQSADANRDLRNNLQQILSR